MEDFGWLEPISGVAGHSPLPMDFTAALDADVGSAEMEPSAAWQQHGSAEPCDSSLDGEVDGQLAAAALEALDAEQSEEHFSPFFDESAGGDPGDVHGAPGDGIMAATPTRAAARGGGERGRTKCAACLKPLPVIAGAKTRWHWNNQFPTAASTFLSSKRPLGLIPSSVQLHPPRSFGHRLEVPPPVLVTGDAIFPQKR